MIKPVLSRISSRSKRLSLVLFTLLCVALFSGVVSSAQPVFQETEFYYYADGARIPLSVSPDFVAASFAPNTFTVDSVNTSAFLQGFGVSASSDPDFNPRPGLIAGYDFQLLPIRDAAATNGIAIADALSASGTTVWANPVFVNGQFTLIVTDELIAGFPKGTPLATIEAYNRANGVVISQQLTDSLVDTYLLRVTTDADGNALTLANRYQTEGVASYAEPNFVTLTQTTASRSDAQELDPNAAMPTLENAAPPLLTANDFYYVIQWALNNLGVHTGAIAGVDIDAQLAWDITTGSASTIIAVIDGGVQLDHPDLDAKIVSPFDPIGNAAGTDFDPTPNDSALTLTYDAQGTIVAGIAAAETNNSIGVAGTCRDCKIMPIRIYYTSSLSNGNPVLTSTLQATAAGIQWAHEQGAAILTNSWTQTPSTTVTNAFRAATTLGRGGLGSFVTIAAGNTVTATGYPTLVGAPAYIASNVAGVLSVAASTFCDTNKNPTDCSGLTWGSHWGTENGIAAPGHKVASTDLTGTNGFTSQDYLEYSGTAVSTPIVAGVAGLLLSSEPTLTAEQVRQRLMETANDIYSPGYDVATGWGRVNANNAVRNITTNSGLAGDRSDTALVIGGLPYTVTTSISGAFTNATDPTLCTNMTNTIWHLFTPANAMSITADTLGSNNDTVLAVVTGTPGAWTSVVCNDAAAPGLLTSAVTFNAIAGTPYYFIVGDWATSVNVPFGAPSSAEITLNVTGTGALTAEVDLQGRPTAPDPLLSVPLDVKLVTGDTVVYEALVTTNTNGRFTIPNTLTVGTSYTLWVKNPHTLAKVLTFTFAGTSISSVGDLLEGDVNNDNLVNVSDFSLLATAFSKTSVEVGYNINADFNGDGIVNITDFSLLATNFSQTGAVRP